MPACNILLESGRMKFAYSAKAGTYAYLCRDAPTCNVCYMFFVKLP